MLETAEQIITIVFLLIILSYYALLLVPKHKSQKTQSFSTISILIPARNEERYIKQSVESVLAAKWPKQKGKATKQIIVINDSSIDNTKDILTDLQKEHKELIILTNKKHSGKSFSLNAGLKKATGEIIAVVDGDSYIQRDALIELKKELEKDKVAGASSVIRVKNRKNLYGMWLHLEVIYTSVIRALFTKIGANVVTPGALSAYRADVLRSVGGFSTDGFAEDADIAIRMIRQGYRAHIVESAISDTNMPHDTKGFFRQRFRIARGVIKLLRTHQKMNTTIIDIYSLPLMFFSYVQAVVMGSITLVKVIGGYNEYFVSKGVYMSTNVVSFFVDWFSVLGFFKWFGRIIIGVEPLSLFAAVGIASTLLTYPLFAWAILKYDRKIDLIHLISFFFMPVYWFINMVVYIFCLPELFRKEQYNIWKKNE